MTKPKKCHPLHLHTKWALYSNSAIRYQSIPIKCESNWNRDCLHTSLCRELWLSFSVESAFSYNQLPFTEFIITTSNCHSLKPWLWFELLHSSIIRQSANCLDDYLRMYSCETLIFNGQIVFDSEQMYKFSAGFGPLHFNLIQGKSSTVADSMKIRSIAVDENPDFIN